MQHIGKYLIVIGVLIVIAGTLLLFFGNKLNWFGNLPGDIKVEKPGFSFYMPLASMLLISIVLSIVLWLGRKLF